MKRSITLKTSKKRREFLTETSDREIYQAIMDAIEAGENIDINGRDNIDGVPLDTQPTHWDVIKVLEITNREYTCWTLTRVSLGYPFSSLVH